MRRRHLVLGVALAVSISVGIVAWALWPGKGVQSEVVIDPFDVSPVLQQLGPGTTLHTIDVVYRRHGPDTPPEAGAEEVRTEAWRSFDNNGALNAYFMETRNANDGTIEGTAKLDGDDLVFYGADGIERKRIPGFRLSLNVDSLKAKIADAITAAGSALANRPGVRETTLDGISVLVLEDHKRVLGDVQRGHGYSVPFISDLNPVEEIHRQYIRADGSWGLRSEVVILSEDGTETIVESHWYEVFEVIPADVGSP